MGISPKKLLRVKVSTPAEMKIVSNIVIRTKPLTAMTISVLDRLTNRNIIVTTKYIDARKKSFVMIGIRAIKTIIESASNNTRSSLFIPTLYYIKAKIRPDL